MRPPSSLPPSALLLSTLASVAILSLPVMAQRVGNQPQLPAVSQSPAGLPAPSPTPASPQQASNPPSRPSSNGQRPPSSDRQQPSPPSEASDPPTPTPVTPTPTPTPARATPSDDKANPTITGPSSVSSGSELGAFPTLTRTNAIPQYPEPSVPPTQDAPFMQHSNLPDGTVFIVVGAVLGALGLSILLWRGIVSLLLHRSVKRAAMAQHTTNPKAGFPAPPAPFYKYTDQESSMSLGAGAAGAVPGRGVRRTNRGPIPSATPSHSNLFFSPTAVPNAAGARNSAFLPSGFYAAGAGSPAVNPANAISLHNLRPDSRGHYANASRHTLAGSPPDSPHYPARRDPSAMSTSSLHLNMPPGQQRAPSAYLEDLLADDPGAFPPQHMPPTSNGPSSTASLAGRADSLPHRI
ncbi:hypothetical protein CDD83_1819 [Cordyceps sp. RAO-2017]|nr:hypothetical protein CDD83_1819 [Cordyceps sp. RAO-2017]